MNQIALNYPALSMFTNSIMFLIVVIAIYFIPEKSKPTKNLGYMMLTAALTALGYAITQGYYSQNSFPRAFALLIIPINHIFVFQLLFQFPTPFFPRVGKIYFWTLSFICLLFSIAFIWKSFTAPIFFDFHGHIYDLDTPTLTKLYTLYLLVSVGSCFGLYITRLIKTEKENRRVVYLLIFCFAVNIIFPVIIYALHKSGLFDRGVFIASFALLTTTGSFATLVTFFNNTNDKTSFLFKIVGASLVSFFLIYNATIFSSARENDTSYDMKKYYQTELLTYEEPNLPDLGYVSEYDPALDKINFQYGQKDFHFEGDYNESIRRAYIRSIIEQEKSEEIDTNKFPVSNKTSTINYLEYFKSKVKTKKDAEIFFQKWEKDSYYFLQKLKAINEDQFSKNSVELLSKEKPRLELFADKTIEFIKNSNLSASELKKQTMVFFVPTHNLKQRTYRIFEGHRFLSYRYLDIKTGKLKEAGYKYEDYRKEIHSQTINSLYMFFIGLILFLIGIPLFLSRSLGKPLQDLLYGVKMVKEGNLTTIVKVKYQDEIGYIADSFNSMVQSIRESKLKLLEYAETLEEKVEERTRELKTTLNQVELLKEQQDGDYFLTTLLLRPLGVNQSIGSRSKIEFFVKQKKEFLFKKEKYQIGGDICISQTIELRGKKYIVFLNADAMGKSVQGAGGILVLGSVFHSILQRTKAYPIYSESSPESWIKKAFKEMHKTFETFDGSMLVSLIFGLVEDNTGLMYYINAEHPWMILYRDNKASFLENDSFFRKLGHSGLETELSIATFQLHPGDMIILGSDGKDDFILSKSEGNRNINDDENIFLSQVESAHGNINKLYDIISSKFELIDDFSVMSIFYPEREINTQEEERMQKLSLLLDEIKAILSSGRGVASAITLLKHAIQEYGKSSEATELLAKVYLKLRKFEEAAIVCKEYIKTEEANTDMLFLASYCMKRARYFEEAIDLSERVKLRLPHNVRNLVHLADLYAATENTPRATKILNKLKRIDPENKKADIIRAKMK